MRLAILIISLISQLRIHAQHEITLELFGPAGHVSVNGVFALNNRMSLRAGLGVLNINSYSCNTGSKVQLPLGIQYEIGSHPHFFEIGGGGVISMVSTGTKMYCPEEENNFFMEENFYGYLIAGYKYDNRKRITYRVFVSPLFRNELKIWGGAGVGLKLKK